MTTPAWIGLGSNLGDRRAILDAALVALAEVPGVVVRAVSSYHQTSPIGGPPGQGPFLNAAAHLETTLDPHQLLAVLQGIETHSGRVRTVRWGERTLDLDILIFGTKFLDTEELKLPHPRLAFRRFVLAPLAEIAPTVVDPMTRRTIAGLLAGLDRRPRLIAIDGSKGRRKATVFARLVAELPGFGISGTDLGSPEADRDVGWFPVQFDILGRKAEMLKSDRRSLETIRMPWIVADYFLELDVLRASTIDWRKDCPRAEVALRYEAHREGMQRVRTLLGEALLPTLVIVLPGDQGAGRRPGLSTTPQLWPESDKPEAIVAEVLATCRGIEGV